MARDREINQSREEGGLLKSRVARKAHPHRLLERTHASYLWHICIGEPDTTSLTISPLLKSPSRSSDSLRATTSHLVTMRLQHIEELGYGSYGTFNTLR